MSAKPTVTSRRLIGNTLFNSLTPMACAALGFFMVPVYVDCLGKETYGIWGLIGSIFGYRFILSMGFASAVDRYIPMYLAQNDHEGVKKVISTCLWFFMVVSGLLVIVTLVAWQFVADWFVIPPAQASVAMTLTLIVGLTWAIGAPLEFSSAGLSGLQRHDLLNLAVLIPTVLRVVLLYVLLKSGYGLITVGLVWGGAQLATQVAQFVLMDRLLPDVPITLRAMDRTLLREMFVYGFNTFFYVLGMVLIRQAGFLVIGIFLTTANVAEFTVLNAGLLILAQVVQSFSGPIKPAVSDLDARGDEARIREVATVSQKYTLILLLPSSAFMIFMGDNFLETWVGPEFANLGPALAVLTLGNAARLSQFSNFLVLIGRGQHQVFGILTVVIGVMFLVLSLILVPLAGMGLMGIAVANLIPMVLVNWVFMPIYLRRKMNMTIRENLREAWWPALLGCAPAVGLVILWDRYYLPLGWPMIGSVVMVVMAVTLVGVWGLALSRVERRRFLGVFQARWPVK